jgi:predicted O-linked N-acetylglucosamine transferase (SPINDLY family)
LPDGFLCFGPPDNLPEIGAPPGLATGVVTFGSFNREFKVSRLALDLWCRILQAVPGSRIVMKSVAGSDPVTREHQFSEFERRGIARDRVELIGFIASQKDHLATYRTIDIALDTFPYHGTTTTLDSLLMGVPVITLAGYHHASRVGASLLTAVGCPEFIARTEDEYVARAVELASDLEKVRALHGALRQRLLQSPLCDGPGFARKFEYALRGMWCNWCAGRGARLSPAEAAAAAFDFSGLAAGPGRPDAG